jgi:hypothetical protein
MGQVADFAGNDDRRWRQVGARKLGRRLTVSRRWPEAPLVIELRAVAADGSGSQEEVIPALRVPPHTGRLGREVATSDGNAGCPRAANRQRAPSRQDLVHRAIKDRRA